MPKEGLLVQVKIWNSWSKRNWRNKKKPQWQIMRRSWLRFGYWSPWKSQKQFYHSYSSRLALNFFTKARTWGNMFCIIITLWFHLGYQKIKGKQWHAKCLLTILKEPDRHGITSWSWYLLTFSKSYLRNFNGSSRSVWRQEIRRIICSHSFNTRESPLSLPLNDSTMIGYMFTIFMTRWLFRCTERDQSRNLPYLISVLQRAGEYIKFE